MIVVQVNPKMSDMLAYIFSLSRAGGNGGGNSYVISVVTHENGGKVTFNHSSKNIISYHYTGCIIVM